MGVLRLFYHFINKYPNIVGTIYKNENNKKLNINVDVLAIDLNAIFHPCCQDVFGYGKKKEVKSFLHNRNNRPQEPLNVLQKRAFQAITREIDNLVRYNNPNQVLYLAVDGVAGMSKQTQQRQRRFRYAKDINETTFDSNCITTGSVFMDDLSKFIGNFIQIKMKTDWSHLKIIFNNGRVPGEGEHKLIHYIKTIDTNLSVSIVSPDADLIMLALGLNRSNIYIFRPNIFDNFAGDFFFVYIDKLRERILSNVNPKIFTPKEITNKPAVVSSTEYYIKRKNKYGSTDNLKHRMLEDFIFYLFMLGNDFLPHIPSLEIPNDGIETLLKCYDRVVSENGFISQHYYIDNNRSIKINYKPFKALMKELSDLENTMLLQKVYKNMTHNDSTLINNIRRSDRGYELDFPKYRKEYYINKLHFGTNINYETDEAKFDSDMFETQVQNLVSEYIRGMVFVLKYYLYTIPTFDWFYPYHYAPLLTDIYNYLPEDIGDIVFEYSEPMSPLEQLLCVLPPQSYRLVPQALQTVMLSKDTPLQHLYPKEFKIDMEGKKNDYEGICLLPFTDSDLIKNEFNKIKNDLTEVDKKRNQTGFIYEYILNRNKEVEIKYFK
jgi:5'-3' exonuclease